MNPLEKQVGGNHYKDLEIQPIVFIQNHLLGFVPGNIVKYLVRSKNRAQDLEKAYHYIELYAPPYSFKRDSKALVNYYKAQTFFGQFQNGKLYASVLGYALSGNKPKAKELLRKFINSGKYSEV